MTREQLAHILRAAAGVTHDDHVIVVGSQAILGTYDEDDLPEPAHASIEADVFFNNDPDLTKTDMVDRALGEDSPFHEMYGYYAQGVDVTTATLPDGWRERLVRFAPTAANGAAGLCLERHDLVLSKLIAGRMKDYEFVTALLDAGLVQIDVLHDRAELLPVGPLRIRRIVEWLHAYTPRRHGQKAKPEGMLFITILFFVTLILAMLSPLPVALLLIEVQFGAGLDDAGGAPDSRRYDAPSDLGRSERIAACPDVSLTDQARPAGLVATEARGHQTRLGRCQRLRRTRRRLRV